MGSRSKGLLVFAALFLTCVCSYSNSLFYDFVFDDRSLVVDNPYIKNLKYIGESLQKGLWDPAYEGDKPNYYRPIQTLSYMLDYRFWRLNPLGYHLTNISLHLLNCLLLFGIIYLLFSNFLIALTSSLLFCAHPVNSSVVTYISGRADLLAGVFILSTFLFFVLALKSPEKRRLYFPLAVISSVLALFSRENALAIPLGIILLSFFIKGNGRVKAFFFLSAILSVFLYLYLRLIVLNIPLAKTTFLGLDHFLRPLNFLYALLLYLSLLVAPVNLYLTHTALPILSWSDPRAAWSLALSIAGLIIWYLKRRNKILNFSLIWLLVFVFPVFFVMTGFSKDKICMAENWLYLAAIGFYVMISYLLYILWSRHKTIAYCLTAAILLAYMTVTISGNSNFRDRITLASHMLRFDPGNKEAHKELADAYLQRREYVNAFKHIEQAIKLAPFDPDLHMIMGAYYEDTGKIKLAVDSYEQLLKREPGSARANNNLGAIYFNNREFDKARVYLGRAIKLNPSLPEPYLNMAKLCQYNNQEQDAVFFYNQAIRLNPDFEEAFINLARIYLNRRDFNSAIGILNRALNSGHKDEPVLMLLGVANGEQGFDAKAGYYFSEALRSGPKSAETMFNLGIFYANRGQLNKAIEIWQEGLRKSPDNEIIRENIGRARKRLGERNRFPEALKNY
ncbi:tetratricopeptide repeat protein [bacterium]|nr:MAG: tetratricopeptide repeat protein [bacterium]